MQGSQQEPFDAPQGIPQIPLIIRKDDKVIHVSDVVLDVQRFFYKSVKLIQVKVCEKL